MSIHTKSAWDHIRRAPFQALAAIFVLTLTFFVATMLSVLVYSSEQSLVYFETRPQIIAFLGLDAKDSEIADLRKKLESDSRLEDISYVSREDALDIYKEATSDNPLLTELVDPTIFPPSLEFSVVDLSFAEDVINELGNEEIVDDVGFTASLQGEKDLGRVVDNLRRVTRYLRIGGGIFVAFQIGSSFLVLMIVIMMRLATRREEIEILNLIGATQKFILSPIVLEAVLYSFISVLLGWFFSLILVLYATPSIISYFGEIPVLPRNTIQLISIFGIILAFELLVGFVLAVLGSIFAVSRVKKKNS